MKIRLQNFQSHIDTEIELAPAGQLTVITGPTDSGKTALIRAFRAVAYNEFPLDFIRIGADRAVITVTLDDGRVVKRERSRGGINRYHLSGFDKPFEGFKDTVPLEIQQALGVQEIQIEGLAAPIRPNLAEQLDGPFLGKGIPSTGRAKVLGYLAGADDVDAANKELGTDIYRADKEIGRLGGELEANQKAQAELAWVEPFGANLEALKGLQAGIQEAEDRRDKLTSLGERLAANEAATTETAAILARLAPLPSAAGFLAEGKAAAGRAAQLNALADKLAANEAAAAENAKTLARVSRTGEAARLVAEGKEAFARAGKLLAVAGRLESMEAQTAEVEKVLARRQNIASVVQLLAEGKAALARRDRLTAVAGRLATIDTDIETARQSAVLAENNLAEARSALQDARASETVICPNCGHEFVPQNLKEVA